MPARVPGIKVKIGKIQLVDQVGHPAGMLMSAMEEHDCAGRGWRRRRPVPIENLCSIEGAEDVLAGEPINHRTNLPDLEVA